MEVVDELVRERRELIPGNPPVVVGDWSVHVVDAKRCGVCRSCASCSSSNTVACGKKQVRSIIAIRK